MCTDGNLAALRQYEAEVDRQDMEYEYLLGRLRDLNKEDFDEVEDYVDAVYCIIDESPWADADHQHIIGDI